MLKAEELVTLQTLVNRIAEALADSPGDEDLRYAYRLALSHALSLKDQLSEIEQMQGPKGVRAHLCMAS